MIFGRHSIKNDKVRVTTTTDKWTDKLKDNSAPLTFVGGSHLGFVRQTKPVFKLDLPQFACLALNPNTVYSYSFLFNCTTVGQAQTL